MIMERLRKSAEARRRDNGHGFQINSGHIRTQRPDWKSAVRSIIDESKWIVLPSLTIDAKALPSLQFQPRFDPHPRFILLILLPCK